MKIDSVLLHIKRARAHLEDARPINHATAFADALAECERVLTAIGAVRSNVLDVETELDVLRRATCYDDVAHWDARGRNYARAASLSPTECERLKVAVVRLERLFGAKTTPPSRRLSQAP